MPPTDRDAALRAVLTTNARALEELSRDVSDGLDMAREARDATAQHSVRLDGLHRKLESVQAEQRMTWSRVLLRVLERASEQAPVQTIMVLGTALSAVSLVLLGGMYSLIWHEPPAMVVGDLLKLLPFAGGE